MTPTRSRPRVVISFLVLLALLTVGMSALPDMDAGAQATRTSSTPTPQATETTGPANAFQIEPTTEAIDDVIANPTEAPTQESIDDEAVAPTGTPDTGEPPIAQGIVRVINRDCPVGIVEDATLSEYLQLCPQPHDGVEFVLNDANGAQAGVTVAGTIEWTDVDPGVFNMTETIPAGYGDPIVFCGYTESQGGGVQHPARQDATNGIVTGTFPYDTFFEYVCYWMNIRTTSAVGFPAADDFGIGDTTNVFLLQNLVCPADVERNETLSYYFAACNDSVDGFTFTLTSEAGSSAKPIIMGEASWSGVPPGPWMLEEASSAQFGDPIVWCGWTAFHDGIVYDGFAQPVDVTGGTVAGNITIPNTTAFCFWMNVQATPGSVVQPQDTTNDLVARAWMCPANAERVEDQGYLAMVCALASDPVEFTLSNTDGMSTQPISSGGAAWDGVPIGEFVLTMSISEGFADPIAYCGWTATHDGMIYDDFPHAVPAPDGVVEGNITVPNTSYACDVYAFSTRHIIRINSLACPAGANPTGGHWDGCSELLAGVEYDLITEEGTTSDTTDGLGHVMWSEVDLGAGGEIQIQEHTPAGLGALTVWCVSTPEVAADAQDFEYFQPPVSDGRITVQPEQHVPYTFGCAFFHIPDGASFETPGSFANPADG